jgi:hypothetical protein
VSIAGSPQGSVRFDFGEGVAVEIRGSPAVRRHFTAEYGAAASDAASPSVAVSFGAAPAANEERYKTVRWRVDVGDPGEQPLQARVYVGGRPRSFALSLLQGYVLEPLLAVAAARVGSVLLPSAAIEGRRGYVLLLGPSRSGKSSLCARALAAGRAILGDDHVLLDDRGRARAFPRRLRVYSDLEDVAPAAYRRLRGRARAALAVRRIVRQATRGWIAPPLRLQIEDVGRPLPATSVELERVVAIRRDGTVRELVQTDLALAAVVELAQAVADEQRARLADAAGWPPALSAARDADRRTLLSGLREVPAQMLAVPAEWGARDAVDAVAAAVGLDA